MVRNPNNDGIRFEGDEYQFKQDAFISCPVSKGSLVLIHGNVVHQSEPNLSDKPRNAFAFHLIEGSYSYDDRNWLQPEHGKFNVLF